MRQTSWQPPPGGQESLPLSQASSEDVDSQSDLLQPDPSHSDSDWSSDMSDDSRDLDEFVVAAEHTWADDEEEQDDESDDTVDDNSPSQWDVFHNADE